MTRHVLILGGHGKVSQLITPILLRNSWTVTSVIRSADQVPTIEKLSAGVSAGKLNVLVRSIEDVKEQAQAQAVLDEIKPDTVFWSAGAGGKGNPERTFAIDRDAAVHFIRAAAATPSIHQFILVSYLASRRQRAPWWDDKTWADAEKMNTMLARYFAAKVVADEELIRQGARRDDFAAISVRPGVLTDEPAGKVELGKTVGVSGDTSRATVAEVSAALMERVGEAKTGWLDLLDGTEDLEGAVERVVREGVNAAEGDEVFENLKK
ncbi:NAD dependent epimerase/dehydratase [Sodiomyces alkalinus F11]|uniref:NAD dependent epimerase/dehydratase n=1 Tax=Sodiomyces alkalinus (strain CBS 110278 / VKM F-3762 / F11) TaxID=1314773 RepID=A0A3N2PPF4_SODAK|nr:NAD dependent epimerase/dehydratase [Sodiomyces alkalinus F11]ROT36389.1 NAD dependent epimerase/dehydratase [Sodiomyces alkalinus F11]